MRQALFSLIFSNASFAAITDGFFFQPFATIEYSAPKFSGNSNSKHLATDNLFSQIKNFDNIALGIHVRIHKYIGINANWSQTDLSTNSLAGYNLSKKADLGLNYYNVSALFFAPLVEDSVVEMFGELGFSSVQSKISLLETNGDYTRKIANENKALIGAGIQIAPFESSKDAFRISVQRYLGKIGVIGANFTTIRLGYIMAF